MTHTERMLDNLASARARLAKEASEGQVDSERLDQSVREIARIEGRLQVTHLQDHIEDPAQLERAVVALLLKSPGDEWSGRGNDTRRAHNDGLRDEARRVLRGF